MWLPRHHWMKRHQSGSFSSWQGKAQLRLQQVRNFPVDMDSSSTADISTCKFKGQIKQIFIRWDCRPSWSLPRNMLRTCRIRQKRESSRDLALRDRCRLVCHVANRRVTWPYLVMAHVILRLPRDYVCVCSLFIINGTSIYPYVTAALKATV